MSRTRRSVLEKTPSGRAILQRAPDRERGKALLVDLRRDDRVTGLRDHRVHRARARRFLKRGEEIRGGKARRYGDFHGAYRL